MPRNLALRFFEAFDQIESGNISDLDIRMLSGRADHWRLRIGAYRAIYTADFELIVIRVGSRGDINKSVYDMEYSVENGFVKIAQGEFEEILAELTALKEAAEERLDVAALDEALRSDEILLPADLVKRMINGESPIRIFREYRGLTQQALADAIGLSKTTISELESGRKDGSIKTISAIAHRLNVTIDDLV